MKFIKFVENNDHEGETWFFWLQIDGNREELSKLAEFLDEMDVSDYYTLEWNEWDEQFVDFAVEEGGWGYMNNHNKVTGKFIMPEDELNDLWLYKGGIEDYFKD